MDRAVVRRKQQRIPVRRGCRMTGRRRILMRGSLMRSRMARRACARRVMGRVGRRFGFCRGGGSEKRQSGSCAENPFLHTIEPPFDRVFMRIQSTAALRDDGKSSGIRLISGEGVMFSLWHYYIILYFALQGTKLYKKGEWIVRYSYKFRYRFPQQRISGNKKRSGRERKAKGFCFRKRSGQN